MIARVSSGSPPRPTSILDISLGATAALATIVGMAVNAPSPVLLGVVLGGLALAVVRPLAGLAALAVLVPLRQPDVVPGPMFLLISAVGLGCLLRLPFDLQRPRIGLGMWFLATYLLLSLVTVPGWLSGGRPGEQEYVLYLAEQLLAVVGLFIIARYLLRSAAVTPYLLLLLGSAAFAGALGILEWWWGGPAGIPVRALMSPAPDAEWTARIRGPFFNQNYFGFLLASAIVLAMATIGRLRRSARVLPVLVAAIALVALALTFSRGATLSLIIGLITLAWFRSRRLAAGLAVTATLLVAIAYPIFLDARASGSGNELLSGLAAENDNTDLRGSILITGVRLFLRDPIVGVGYGRFTFESPWFEQSLLVTEPHNSYTQILAEQGLVGGAAALGCVVALGMAIRAAGPPYRAAGAALLATVLANGMFVAVTSSIQAAGLTAFALGATLAASAAEREPLRQPIPVALRSTQGRGPRRTHAGAVP